MKNSETKELERMQPTKVQQSKQGRTSCRQFIQQAIGFSDEDMFEFVTDLGEQFLRLRYNSPQNYKNHAYSVGYWNWFNAEFDELLAVLINYNSMNSKVTTLDKFSKFFKEMPNDKYLEKSFILNYKKTIKKSI